MKGILGTLKLMLDITNEDEDSLLKAYLELAESKILNKLYPYGYTDDAELPERYNQTKLNIAMYLYSKRGAEGETSNTENGITRQWGGADVPDSYLKEVIPMAKGVYSK